MKKPNRVSLGEFFNVMTDLASAQHGVGEMNSAYKDGFEDCFAILTSHFVTTMKERDILLAAMKKHIANYERPMMICHDLVYAVEKVEGKDEN